MMTIIKKIPSEMKVGPHFKLLTLFILLALLKTLLTLTLFYKLLFWLLGT